MSLSKRQQPAWAPPKDGGEFKGLKLWNSLTRQKEPFIPISGNRVTWYNCGPTVYDASHMGHARTYLTFDILRRVLSDYFKYDIFYVMNITDVDDKIIRRARQNHLYQEYLDKKPQLEKVIDNCNEVLKKFQVTAAETTDPDKKQMQERQLAQLTSAVSSVEEAVKSADSARISKSQEELLLAAKDLLSDWLDKQFGSDVKDNAIFSKLPQFWEERYHEDMDALNILRSDCLTRVSEYIPENVTFIEKIIDHGFAYESNGSVYFDVAKFDEDKNHHYAKLVPEVVGDANLLKEGEGALSADDSEKRSSRDFALWKMSKPGEPSWDSPWGKGRPGWHIECSVMASAVLGESIDIHTGGVDLKFPHHDNELAQAEAYHCNDHWIRYFLHSGHLTIAGCKMSKSLKNFITIQEVLERYSARQLRLTFLMHSWKDTLDYSDNTMELSRSYERTINEFLMVVPHVLRTTAEIHSKWGPPEFALNKNLHDTKAKVHEALCDNVDTRNVLEAIRELVIAGNGYLQDPANKVPNGRVLATITEFITDIFQILGISFGSAGTGSEKEMIEGTVIPVLEATAGFRDRVRAMARELKATDILKECDALRDDILPELGVRLEDKENGHAVIKMADKKELLREKQLKAEMAEKKRLEKEKKKAELAEKQAKQDAQKKIPPTEMFKSQTDKYSKFDDKGMPTHTASGDEMSAAQVKKLQKLYQAQEKKYNDFMKSQEK